MLLSCVFQIHLDPIRRLHYWIFMPIDDIVEMLSYAVQRTEGKERRFYEVALQGDYNKAQEIYNTLSRDEQYRAEQVYNVVMRSAYDSDYS